jgi:hypothetical protein
MVRRKEIVEVGLNRDPGAKIDHHKADDQQYRPDNGAEAEDKIPDSQ